MTGREHLSQSIKKMRKFAFVISGRNRARIISSPTLVRTGENGMSLITPDIPALRELIVAHVVGAATTLSESCVDARFWRKHGGISPAVDTRSSVNEMRENSMAVSRKKRQLLTPHQKWNSLHLQRNLLMLTPSHSAAGRLSGSAEIRCP